MPRFTTPASPANASISRARPRTPSCQPGRSAPFPTSTPPWPRSTVVLKPGGTLHFVEHGISPDPKVARRQGRIEPVNKALFGGCHLTRDIPALLTRAGFVIDTMTTYQHAKEPRAFGWTFEGRAAVV